MFLGVRIACAECHHHPFDRWSTADYYGMTAFFTGVAVKPIGRDEAVCVDGVATAKNPRTGEESFAHPLGRAGAGDGAGSRATAAPPWPTG